MTRYRMSAQKDRGPISFITCTLRAFLYTVLQNGGAALTRIHLLRPRIFPNVNSKGQGPYFFYYMYLKGFFIYCLQNRGAALTRVHFLRPQIIPQCQFKRTGALFLLLHVL